MGYGINEKYILNNINTLLLSSLHSWQFIFDKKVRSVSYKYMQLGFIFNLGSINANMFMLWIAPLSQQYDHCILQLCIDMKGSSMQLCVHCYINHYCSFCTHICRCRATHIKNPTLLSPYFFPFFLLYYIRLLLILLSIPHVVIIQTSFPSF